MFAAMSDAAAAPRIGRSGMFRIKRAIGSAAASFIWISSAIFFAGSLNVAYALLKPSFWPLPDSSIRHPRAYRDATATLAACKPREFGLSTRGATPPEFRLRSSKHLRKSLPEESNYEAPRIKRRIAKDQRS